MYQFINTYVYKRRRKNSAQKSGGFTLIETFVAVTILAMALVGPMSIISNSIVAASYSRDEVTAFYLAQEAIEFVRSVRDNNNRAGLSQTATWLTGLSLCMNGNTCVVDSMNNNVRASNYCGSSTCPLQFQSGVYAYVSGWGNSAFTRTVQIESVATDQGAVYVTVTWKTGALPQRTFKIKEAMTNWAL